MNLLISNFTAVLYGNVLEHHVADGFKQNTEVWAASGHHSLRNHLLCHCSECRVSTKHTSLAGFGIGTRLDQLTRCAIETWMVEWVDTYATTIKTSTWKWVFLCTCILKKCAFFQDGTYSCCFEYLYLQRIAQVSHIQGGYEGSFQDQKNMFAYQPLRFMCTVRM